MQTTNYLAVLCFVVGYPTVGFSQLQPSFERYQTTPTHYDRYGVDYEVVGLNVGAEFSASDSTLISGLSLDNLEYYRHDENDVVVYDKITHVDVLLYSRKRMMSGDQYELEHTTEQ